MKIFGFNPLSNSCVCGTNAVQDPLEQEEDKTLCCMCCASGNISAVVSIPRRGFVPGEIIPVQAEIFNNSSTSVSKSYFNFKRVWAVEILSKYGVSSFLRVDISV